MPYHEFLLIMSYFPMLEAMMRTLNVTRFMAVCTIQLHDSMKKHHVHHETVG
jgi:hypothetical protein